MATPTPFPRTPQFYEQQQSKAAVTSTPIGTVLTPNGLQSSAGVPSHLVAGNLGTSTAVITPPSPTTVNIGSGGAVTSGGVQYIGNAVIPNTGGQTANTILQQGVASSGYGVGRFTGSMTYGIPQQQAIADYQIPTQEEILNQGGGVFYKPSEAKMLGINEIEGTGSPSVGQRVVYQSEELLGEKAGSSGVSFLPIKSSVTVDNTSGSKNRIGDTMLLAVDKDTGEIGQEMRDRGLVVNTATRNLEDHRFVLRADGWYDLGARNNAGIYGQGTFASKWVQDNYAPRLYSGQASSAKPFFTLSSTDMGIRQSVSNALNSDIFQRLTYGYSTDNFLGKTLDLVIPKTALGALVLSTFFIDGDPVTDIKLPQGVNSITAPYELLQTTKELGLAGTALRTGIYGYITYPNIKNVLNSDLPLPERVVSGVFAGLGVAGIGSEVSDFAITKYATFYPASGERLVGDLNVNVEKEIDGKLVTGSRYVEYYETTPAGRFVVTTKLKDLISKIPEKISEFTEGLIPSDNIVYRAMYAVSKPLSGQLPSELGYRISTFSELGEKPYMAFEYRDGRAYLTSYNIKSMPIKNIEEYIANLNLNLNPEYTYSAGVVLSQKYARIFSDGDVIIEKSPYFEGIDVNYDEEKALIKAPTQAYLRNLNIDMQLTQQETIQEDELFKIIRAKTISPLNPSVDYVRRSTIVVRKGGEISTEPLNQIISLRPFPSLLDVYGTEDILNEGTLSKGVKEFQDKLDTQIAKENKPSRRTPLSRTFGETEVSSSQQQIEKQVYVNTLAKAPLPALKSPTINILQPELPRMVGGAGLSSVPYAGENLYEVSEPSIQRPAIIKPVFEPQLNNLKQDDILNYDMKQDMQFKQDMLVKQDMALKQDMQFKQDVLVKQDMQLKQEMNFKQDMLFKQDQQFKQDQLFKQDELLKQIPQSNIPNYVYQEPSIEPTFLLPNNKKNKVKIGKQVPTFNVFLRKRGQFQPIAQNLPRGEALYFGSNRALHDIGRTFKIIPSGKTTEVFEQFDEKQFMPNVNQFRGYKVRRGVRIQTPDQFVQLTSANLQSYEEKAQIADAKKLSRFINYKF